MSDQYSVEQLLNRRVVIDTQGPLVYIGRLRQIDASGYWLSSADVHDRADGHSTKESYVSDARQLAAAGTPRINRRLVFVARHAVVSLSALSDVADVDFDDDPGLD